MNKDIQNSGKYCSSCNAPEKGYWVHGYEWEFVRFPVEHNVICEDINAPLLNHMDWDYQATHGKAQPIIPRPFGPTREGSRLCLSGSLASGGNRTYCTCEACF